MLPRHQQAFSALARTDSLQALDGAMRARPAAPTLNPGWCMR